MYAWHDLVHESNFANFSVCVGKMFFLSLFGENMIKNMINFAFKRCKIAEIEVVYKKW